MISGSGEGVGERSMMGVAARGRGVAGEVGQAFETTLPVLVADIAVLTDSDVFERLEKADSSTRAIQGVQLVRMESTGLAGEGGASTSSSGDS